MFTVLLLLGTVGAILVGTQCGRRCLRQSADWGEEICDGDPPGEPADCEDETFDGGVHGGCSCSFESEEERKKRQQRERRNELARLRRRRKKKQVEKQARKGAKGRARKEAEAASAGEDVAGGGGGNSASVGSDSVPEAPSHLRRLKDQTGEAG